MTLKIPPAPPDFDAYWNTVMEELAALPAAAHLSVNLMRTTDFATVYDVRLTSMGPYRLFAYYSVPNGDGPFPVIYHTPRYGSVVTVPPYEERQRYITLALCHRGQRLADQPFAAAYPGLLTEHITDPARYVYRGIVADCCRAVDFLLSRPEVDASRIAAVGNDLALITAGLRPQIDSVICTPEILYAAEVLAPQTQAYPMEEYNDFIRTHPDKTNRIWQTLRYFEPTHFAPRVKAATLLVSGSEQDLFAPAVVAPLAAAVAGPVECYETAHSGYKDGVYKEAWLRQRYGFEQPLVPAHWQSA